MVTVKQTMNTEIKGTGILTGVTEEGLILEDEKLGEQIISFQMLELLFGKKVTVSFSSKRDKDLSEE